MKITNGVFWADNFLELVKRLKDFKGFKPKDAYSISLLTKELGERQLLFEGIRKEILERHGKVEPDGNEYKVPDENCTAFLEDMKEVSEIEFEVEFNKIPYYEGLNFSPGEMTIAESIIDFSSLKD